MCVMGAILIYIELFITNNDVNNKQGVADLKIIKELQLQLPSLYTSIKKNCSAAVRKSQATVRR